MELNGDMFEGWKNDLIEHFFGDVEHLDVDDEITVTVREESTGEETTIWNLMTSLDEDGLAEEYDVIVDALTHPAQVVQAGTSVPSFEEFCENHDAFPTNTHVLTESVMVKGPFQIRVTASNVS